MPHLPAIVAVVAAILITVGRIGGRWPVAILGSSCLRSRPRLLCWAQTRRRPATSGACAGTASAGLFADRLR